MSTQRIVVTGANGYLGRHIVRELIEKGNDVVALCRKPSADVSALGAQVRLGDVGDKASLADAFAGCSQIVHAAGNVSRDPKDAEALFSVHVVGTKNVLDAAREAGAKKAVVISTSGTVAVSDDADFVATETSETPITLIQRWPYYRAKLFAEQAAFARNDPSFQVVCLNPTLLLGPGDLLGSSTEDVRLFLERRVPFVPPGGLSFVDVRDVAACVPSALERGRAGQRYLLGAVNMTMREFLGRLERASGVKAPVLPVPRAPELARAGLSILKDAMDRVGMRMPLDAVSADMSQFFWYLDATLAETELDFAPRDPQLTLHDTVQDLRARGVVWPEES